MRYSPNEYKIIQQGLQITEVVAVRSQLAVHAFMVKRELKEDQLGLIDSGTSEWEPKVAEVPGL